MTRPVGLAASAAAVAVGAAVLIARSSLGNMVQFQHLVSPGSGRGQRPIRPNPQATRRADNLRRASSSAINPRAARRVASAPAFAHFTTNTTMSEDKETLIAMGFAPERADWALRVKKGQGVQAAMDFLLAHADDPVPDPEDEMEEDSELCSGAVMQLRAS